MTDPYGVSDRLLVGGMNDELFAHIGRITVLTSLVEVKVTGFSGGWTDERQVPAQLTELKKVASRLPDPDDRNRTLDFIERVKKLRTYRNMVVHSAWPRDGFAWRYQVRAADPSESGVLTVETTPQEMREHIVLASNLVDEANDFASLLEAARHAEHRVEEPGLS